MPFVSWHDIAYVIMAWHPYMSIDIMAWHHIGMSSHCCYHHLAVMAWYHIAVTVIMAWHHILCRYHGATKLSWWISLHDDVMCRHDITYNANIMGMYYHGLSCHDIGYVMSCHDIGYVLSWHDIGCIIMAWHRMYYHGMTSSYPLHTYWLRIFGKGQRRIRIPITRWIFVTDN